MSSDNLYEANEIYRGENYRVDHLHLSGDLNASRTLVVTFSERGNRDFEGLGFGGRFLLANGFDVLAVKSRVDRWYGDFPEEALATLGRVSALYQDVATYGSSMGGFAAIKFAGQINVKNALAISPQIDITKDWDTRWRREAEFLKGEMPLIETVSARCRYVVVYDPLDLDVEHFQRFQQIIPNLQAVPALYGGHPSGAVLNQAGALKTIALAAFRGDLIKPPREAIRGIRARSPKYLFNLQVRLAGRKKKAWAADIAERLVKLDPMNPEYNTRAALAHFDARQIEQALHHAAIAAAMSPMNPHILGNFAKILVAAGRRDLAKIYLDRGIEIRPDVSALRQMKKHLFGG